MGEPLKPGTATPTKSNDAPVDPGAINPGPASDNPKNPISKPEPTDKDKKPEPPTDTAKRVPAQG